MDYRTAKDRYTSEEARTLDRLHNDMYAEARQAAEAHRQVTLAYFTLFTYRENVSSNGVHSFPREEGKNTKTNKSSF